MDYKCKGKGEGRNERNKGEQREGLQERKERRRK